MIKVANGVEEVLDGKGFIAEILHEDLALGLVHQVDAWRQHAHLAHSIDALDLLEDTAARQFLVERWDSVVFDESLLADTRLSKKFG